MRDQKSETRDSLQGSVGAIVLAAGGSLRMEGIDKAFASLLGQSLVAHSLEVLERCHRIDQIVLVMAKHNLDRGRALVKDKGWVKINQVCLGGQRRQDSVRLGLERLFPCQWVLVHDSARPCLDEDIIHRGLEAARETGAAVAAVAVKDTIKVVDSSGLVLETPERKSLWAAQTPQIFRRDLLVEAHSKIHEDVTDDSTMLERLGRKVKLFMGSHDNIKVTTTQDLILAEAVLASRKG